jgi:23S rRNA (cytosine1962-C5)-methyltransferase
MQIVKARARQGHPWIFSNEILSPPVSELVPGAAVEVTDPAGRLIGRGYGNPRSLISVRLLTREREDIDSVAFFERRLRAAAALRAKVLPGRRSLRVCAGEADLLPGLLLDKYEDVLVAQITSLGMETRRELLKEAIERVFAPTGVVSRDDIGLRTLEGIEGESHVWWGAVPDRVTFDENGVRFAADLLHGQKTGFFFDQAENRSWMAARASGARVLDVYAHLGGWALHALAGGAREAVTVDSSAPACAMIRANAELNGVADRLTAMQGDARDALRELGERGERFDVVCVDPPAFAKNRKSAGVALGAYKAVNGLALRLVAPGGLYFTSSCSHHVVPERFEEAVLAGARQAGRSLVLLRRGMQAADHPVLPGVPETEYLKHLAFAVR